MAKHTENYGFTKPEPNDFYDIEVGNNNLDVIDGLIKGNEDAIDDVAGPGRTTETVVGAYVAAQQAVGQVGSVDEKIGSAGDTGGSTTAGSVMAKMNAILQKFGSAWTDARAAKLDNLDGTISSRATQASLNTLQGTANTINDTKLGATNNTGGSSTAGTVMAKLNALLVAFGFSGAGQAGTRKAVFTANGSFTVPANVTAMKILAFAAGNDGEDGLSPSAGRGTEWGAAEGGGGGGGGGYGAGGGRGGAGGGQGGGNDPARGGNGGAWFDGYIKCTPNQIITVTVGTGNTLLSGADINLSLLKGGGAVSDTGTPYTLIEASGGGGYGGGGGAGVAGFRQAGHSGGLGIGGGGGAGGGSGDGSSKGSGVPGQPGGNGSSSSAACGGSSSAKSNYRMSIGGLAAGGAAGSFNPWILPGSGQNPANGVYPLTSGGVGGAGGNGDNTPGKGGKGGKGGPGIVIFEW